ncbi:MAG: hypothetical protein P1U50_01190 [Parvibaculaceae bacterium]|nr:hypothetical protein [Parvibaculaceae bacterium]
MSMIEKHGQAAQDTARVVDVAAASTMVGSLMGYFPAIAALFTIVWTGIRIYETDTVQSILMRWGLVKAKPSQEADD